MLGVVAVPIPRGANMAQTRRQPYFHGRVSGGRWEAGNAKTATRKDATGKNSLHLFRGKKMSTTIFKQKDARTHSKSQQRSGGNQNLLGMGW